MRRSGSAIYHTGISKVWRRTIGTYDGELDVSWANFLADVVDVVNPGLVRIEVVGRQADDLDATSSKVGGATSDLSEFSRADLGRIGIGDR